MSPPTEQLIRDYLNRLSVAGRGQLGPEDRRALTARTRAFIEHQTGLSGPPTAVEVARLLAGLGDPAALVSEEVRRLAELRGEDPPEPAGKSGGFLARVLGREPDVSASWRWPAPPGERPELRLKLMDAAGTADNDGTGPDNHTTGPGEAEPGRTTAAQEHVARAGTQAAATAPADPPVPVQRAPAQRVSAQGGPQDKPAPRLTIVPPPGPGPQAAPDLASDPAPGAGPDLTTELPAVSEREAGRAALVADAVVGWARSKPLEAAAVIVTGLGGAIYPPVWLLGAALALASKRWDYRDKWLGLGVPVLLTIIATVAGVGAAGSQNSMSHHVHVAWIFADIASRASALLGAAYLAWRSAHDRKSPEIPPWNRPRRVA